MNLSLLDYNFIFPPTLPPISAVSIGDHCLILDVQSLPFHGPRDLGRPLLKLPLQTSHHHPKHGVDANVSDSTQIADLTLEIKILVEL
jgi:hypothetical protein